MSRQPAAKTSRQVKSQPNKEQELYEHVEMQEQQSHYMTINRPNHVEVENNSQLAGQISTEVKREKCVVIALIAVFLVIALVVSLVAVIIHSPLVRSGDNTESSASTARDDMLLRIQQLEAMLQGTNHSFKLLQESLEAQVQRQSDYDGTVSSQFLMQNNMLASHSSQIAGVQSSIQASTLVQNNLRQDLDHLRTVNLYEGCIHENRTCTMSTTSTTTYRICSTAYLSINPGVSPSPNTL